MNSFLWGSKSKGINLMKWDRLCVDKKFRGLGFRNLEGFNLVMLVKHGWSLITDPKALVSKLYKVRYFPNGDFLNVSLGQNPNFTW